MERVGDMERGKQREDQLAARGTKGREVSEAR